MAKRYGNIARALAVGGALALLLPASGAAAQDDGDGGVDLGVAFQGWFHLSVAATADFRFEQQPTEENESLSNALGFGLLGELRIAKFFGVGATFQWLRANHEGDRSGDKWSVWDLDVHVRLRVPLFFLNLYARVPFGISVASLPSNALRGLGGDPGIMSSDETNATGWNAATLFGVEFNLLKVFAVFFEIGPTWRHLPFDVPTDMGDVEFEARTRDLTMNFGLTLEF